MWLHSLSSSFFTRSLSLLRCYDISVCCMFHAPRAGGKFHKSFDSLSRKAIINLHRLFSQLKSKRRVIMLMLSGFTALHTLSLTLTYTHPRMYVCASHRSSMRFMLHNGRCILGDGMTKQRYKDKRPYQSDVPHRLNDSTSRACFYLSYSASCHCDPFYLSFIEMLSTFFFVWQTISNIFLFSSKIQFFFSCIKLHQFYVDMKEVWWFSFLFILDWNFFKAMKVLGRGHKQTRISSR